MIKKIVITFIAALLSATFTSCRKVEENYITDDFFAMNTFVTVCINTTDSDITDTAEKTVKDIESIFSKTLTESDIYRINNSQTVIVSDECASVLMQMSEIANNTQGAFNPCMGQICELWDVTGKQYVPSEDEINTLLPYCDYTAFSLDGNTVSKDFEKTMFDTGAAVKGYAAQKAIEQLKAQGVKNAMISIGGNIAVTGEASGRNGVWRIAITNPFYPDETAGYIDCTDTVISVSGDYERYFENNGIVYHHIFDSKTGKPADSDVKSVAVIAKDGLVSDALSTAIFCMGKEKALQLYNSRIYDFEAVIFTKDGIIYCTNGISNKFVLHDNAKFDKTHALMKG